MNEIEKKKSREYYQKNRDKILQRSRDRYHNNIEYERNRRRVRYLKYKDDELAKQKLRTTPESRHEYWIKYKNQAKEDFLEMYGSACSCCGETISEFLTIEHILGQKGIKGTLKKKSTKAYRQATIEYRPDLYEVLCMNCNLAKGKLGYCPHTKD